MPSGVYERTPEMNAANSKSQIGVPHSPEHNAAVSDGMKKSDAVKAAGERKRGIPFSPEHCAAISESKLGVPHTSQSQIVADEATGDRLRNVPFTPEHCDAISKALAGENNPNWKGGISYGKYCPKFNETIKQYIRDKYDNCDYMSGIPAHICNPQRNLDVHHIDYNKMQGCDDHEWRLIPLSQRNHIRTNTNRSFWNRLFTYSLQYDETY